MYTMDSITTSFIGDWMYNEKKLEALTEERAVEDIFFMSTSLDYAKEDTNTALDMAAKQLNIDRLQLVAGLLVKNADKMSEV